ncbi:hypothetical protein AOLI_G00137610 [Acnodon oligacanthus]
MKYIYRFSQGLRLRQNDMISDDIAGSCTTLTKMARCIQEVCIHAMHRHRRKSRQCLGGEFFVIDESCFRHQRKYGQGQFGNTWRRKKWVFGMMGVDGPLGCLFKDVQKAFPV